MATCRVIAQVYNPDASPWRQGVVLRYVLQRGSYTLSGNYPRGDFAAKIGADGIAIANLWINEEGIEPTNWQVFFPNGESDIFSIPPGTTSATLEYLRLLNSTPNPGPPSLGAAINTAIAAHNADPNAHSGLGSGSAVYSAEIEPSDLVGSIVVVEHALPSIAREVTLFDNEGPLWPPWRNLDSTHVRIDFEGMAPITQTYQLTIEA